MKLYNYYRSSTSFRVRIALALKGLEYEYVPVHLRKNEQRYPEYLARNPEGLVPLLELDDGTRLTQSMAIMEYLDEAYPDRAPLLPRDMQARARVRALAQIIGCEIHPLDNLRVLRYLVHTLDVGEDAKLAWYRHWVREGLQSFNAHLMEQPAAYCHGDAPTMADCCLVPQVFNAQRFDCDLSGLDQLLRVFDTCMKLPAFRAAQPSACPDADP